MTRFALIKTTPVLLGMLALTACPSDDVTPQDTEGTSTGEETTTMTPPPMTDTTAVDPDSASGTGTSEDSATTAVDPCEGVECEPGQECIGGACFDCVPTCEPTCDEGFTCQCPENDLCCEMTEPECLPPVCPLPSVGGNHAPCLDAMGMTSDEPCDGGICVIDDEPATAAVCMVQGCEANCQCPAAPDTGNATVTCDDILGETEGECYLDCGNDETCPDGMLCLFGFVCLYSDAEPVTIPPYGDCFNAPPTDSCEVGGCVAAPDAGVCTEPCGDAADCSPGPGTGDAPVACIDITGDGAGECVLDCSGGETCADGMVCYQDFVCLWPEIVPPGDAYGDCLNVPGSCEPSEDTCLDDGAMMPGAGACSQSGCADATECPVAPATGDSVVSCDDFGDGNTCYLDCGMGETCPDGMECTVVTVGMGGGAMDISACMWPFVAADFTCADDDLASAVGAAVAMGTTVGGGDEFDAPCSAGNSEDVEFQWTAPADGSYTFDTVGSGFDTILTVLTHCAGVDLACNDDTMMLLSEVTVDLVAGQSVLIVIDGYNETGNYVLNIN